MARYAHVFVALTALIAGSACAQIPPEYKKMDVLDPRSLDPAAFKWTYSPNPAALSEDSRKANLSDISAAEARSDDVPASLVGTLSIDIRQLIRATPREPVTIPEELLQQLPPSPSSNDRMGLIEGRPAGEVSVTIEGLPYVLRVLQATADPVFPGVRHFTTAVVNHPPHIGIARFSVDLRSHLVVGTLEMDSTEYRIISSDRIDTQLVFRIQPGSADAASSEIIPRRYRRVRTGQNGKREIAELEERHLKVQALADYEPSVYYTIPGDDGRATLQWQKPNPQARVTDISALGSPDALRHLVGEFAPLTRARGDEDLRLGSVTTTKEGTKRVVYYQYVQGVLDRQSILVVDEEGNIRSWRSNLRRPEALPDFTERLSDKEAQRLAIAALEEDFGRSGDFHYALQPKPADPMWAGTRILAMEDEEVPGWIGYFNVSSGGMDDLYQVIVNLTNGHVNVAPAGKPTQ